jgi:rubrerythrin
VLRRLLGQEEDRGNEQVRRIIGLIDRYCGLLRASYEDGLEDNEPIYRIEAWASGFRDSLNELEQSQHAADWFSRKVKKPLEEEMDEEELANYQRHVYFYKNAIVRVFSVLDKLGYFLNELFGLRTERVKPRYSFFTVLRQMKEAPGLEALYQEMQRIKTEYKDELNVLRNKRNTEIHYVNVEMLDDILQTRKHFTRANHIEDLRRNMKLLDQGCAMVYRTMETVFAWCIRLLADQAAKKLPQRDTRRL